MSDTTPKNPNGPLIAHREPGSAAFVKIWGQQTKEGKPFYTTSVGVTYTDTETGEPRDTNSMSQAEMNKLPRLINLANQTMRLLNDPTVTREQALDAARNPQGENRQAFENGLKAQRDAVLAQARSPSISPDQVAPNQTPEIN